MSAEPINAVAAAIGDVWEVFDAGLNEDGFPERGMRTRSPESIARALAEAGWLRTAEDRAVLDAAEEETAAEERYRAVRYPEPWGPAKDAVFTARATRREAVRVRRVAAGGTEPADPPEAQP